MNYVIKRDGSTEIFDSRKIVIAVRKAYKAAGENFSKKVEKDLSAFDATPQKSVEQIQDEVECYLMKANPKVAQIYIRYRYQHQLDRAEEASIREEIQYMKGYQQKDCNAANSSATDPNANMNIKNVANMEAEVYKPRNRKTQRIMIYDSIKKLYGKELADQYLIDLESHLIYAHDEASSPAIKNYCEAVTLYPLAVGGTSTMDGTGTEAPHWLQSFVGQLYNLTFLLTSQCKGAVAFGEFFNFFDYYAVKDFGPTYHLKEDLIMTTAVCNHRYTIGEYLEQMFQTIVFNWNQPAGNRAYQSPFTNISYYDSNYWKAMFEDFVFPDGTKPQWERVSYLQKKFMRWFNKQRAKVLLTFPVESMALLTDGKDIIDRDYRQFTAEMYHEGHSFFTYMSSNPDSLASCCFKSNTKFLWRSSTKGVNLTTFKECFDLKYTDKKENFKVFHNGSWVDGKVIKLSGRSMYKVSTYNNKEYCMTDNHINVTLSGEKSTKDLTTDDYLLFNTAQLNAVPENDEHLTYEQGFVIGAFLGDGSFGTEINNTVYETIFSLSIDKIEPCTKAITSCMETLDLSQTIKLGAMHNNVFSTRISSKELVEFIKKWTLWKRGTYAYNKKLNLNCLLQSVEFRKGILAGWYATDGGNSNRCYTTSPELVDNMEALITSLGMNSVINISNRTDEKVVIREQEFNRNYPLYCVRWYEQVNTRSNKDEAHSWVKYNNSIYFKIKSIKKVEDSEEVYCIECKNSQEPYFTLPSGLITHNCRLRNEITENVFSFTNGLTGVQTGSCNVITLNLNRLTQDWVRTSTLNYDLSKRDPNLSNVYLELGNNQSFIKYLTAIVQRVHRYHIAYKTMLYEWEANGMFTASNAGYISMKKLYSTIGLNGINEAAEFLGIKCSVNTVYKQFCTMITKTISDLNKEEGTDKFKFNTEFVPAESLSSKNYQWDKADGYKVPENRNLYNSYFYLADDPNTTVLDRFRLHGEDFTKFLDGGVGLHCNLEEHLSTKQYLKLMDYAAHVGCNYFTFNVPNCQCDKCGHIEKHHFEECPKCGSTETTDWTRVIGYLRPVPKFDKERYKEALTRVYSKPESIQYD